MSQPHLIIPPWHVTVAREVWRVRSNGGGFATLAALILLIFFHFLFRRLRLRRRPAAGVSSPAAESGERSSDSRIASIITDADLAELIKSLDSDPIKDRENWEDVISKRNDSISYQAWRHKNTAGPPKYLSTTTFTKCQPETLRDFYMDNEFRKDWDNTIFSHESVETDIKSGTEIGRTVKKFPFLTPREYVLAWRVWEGKEGSFYCFTKECEHPLIPKQRNYVRVSLFRSGWCIRKVPGTDACEIKVVHEESNGMNIEMAKLAFAKGIWNYVCKMDRAFRRYSASYSRPNPAYSPSILSMRSLIRKVPSSLEELTSTSSGISVNNTKVKNSKQGKITKMPSRKWIANGLFLAGTVICLSKGRSTIGAQLAMACILKKLTNNKNKNNNDENKNNKDGNNNINIRWCK